MAIQDLKDQIARLPEQPGVYLWGNAAGDTIYTAWSAIPDPLVAELLAAAYDAVVLDMQHGCHSTDSALRGIAAVVAE